MKSVESHHVVPTVTKQPECLLEAMELIVDSSRNSNLSEQFFEAAKNPVSYLAHRLQITPMQAVLLSLIVERQSESKPQLKDIAKHIGSSFTRVLRFSSCLEELDDRFYVRIKRSYAGDQYFVPIEVIGSLRKDEPYIRPTVKISDVDEFFEQYRRIYDDKRFDRISQKLLVRLNEENLEQIKDTFFAKTLKVELPDEMDRLIFVHMAYLYLAEEEDFIDFDHLRNLYDEGMPIEKMRQFRMRATAMHKCLIENDYIDEKTTAESYCLTDFSRHALLAGVTVLGNNRQQNDWD